MDDNIIELPNQKRIEAGKLDGWPIILTVPDLGRIAFDLNAMTPSVMIAIRRTLIRVLDDPSGDKERQKLQDVIDTLTDAISTCVGPEYL